MTGARDHADPTSPPGPKGGRAPSDHAHFERLRRRLRWQILGAYVVPLVLASVYFHFQFASTLRSDTDAHLRSIADNQRNTVDLFLQERVADVRAAFRPGAFEVPPTDEALDGVLAELRDASGTFADAGVFDPEGTLVAYSGPHETLRGRSYGEEPWFQRLRRGERDHYISNVYLGFRDRPHFVIAVRRTIGERVWTLRASVDPQRFGEYVGRSHLVEEGEAFIVNREGARQAIAAGSVGEGSAPTFAFEQTGDTRIVEVEEGGRRYLCAVAWLTEHDWAVVVRLPEQSALAPMRRAQLILTLFVLVAVVVVVLLAFRATRRLVGRLEEEAKAKGALERQLFSAAKLASVGEMAAGVAHEINNPLAVIHEEAGFMLDVLDPEFHMTPDLDDFGDRLRAISDAALRGRSITSKLLAFARKHDHAPEATDVVGVIEESLAIKETEFRVSNIEVRRFFEEDLAPVAINRNELEQVLLNLLNNAKDAVGEEGGLIQLRARSRGRAVDVEVQDSGCGMSVEEAEKIFFPFYTTKEVGKGTGLGLAISHGIVEAIGGSIRVESTLGEGTTFVLALPVAAEADGTEPGR